MVIIQIQLLLSEESGYAKKRGIKARKKNLSRQPFEIMFKIYFPSLQKYKKKTKETNKQDKRQENSLTILKNDKMIVVTAIDKDTSCAHPFLLCIRSVYVLKHSIDVCFVNFHKSRESK